MLLADVRVQIQLLASSGYPQWPTEIVELHQRYADAPSARMRVLTRPAAVAAKLSAWAGRRAPRDLYDLWALATRGDVDADAVALGRPEQRRPGRREHLPCSVSESPHRLTPISEGPDSACPKRCGMVDDDDRRSSGRDRTPAEPDGGTDCSGRAAKADPETVNLKADVIAFVHRDPPADPAQHRIGSALGEGDEVAHRHSLGDEEHPELRAQPEQATHSRESGIRPMSAESGCIKVIEATTKQRGVLLLLSHEEFESSEIDRITGGCRFREQAVTISAFAKFETLKGPDKRPSLRFAHGRGRIPPDCRFRLPVSRRVGPEVSEPKIERHEVIVRRPGRERCQPHTKPLDVPDLSLRSTTALTACTKSRASRHLFHPRDDAYNAHKGK